MTRTVPRVVATAENAEPKLVVRGETLWISSPASGTLARLDGADADPTSTPAAGILSVAASEDGVWFSVDVGEVRRVDGGGSLMVGTRPLDLASGGEEVWVAAYDDRAARRVDGESLRGTGEVRLGAGPVAVAVGQDAVGIAVQSP